MDFNKLPVWLKTFFAGLAGAVGGAIVDIVPSLIKGGVVDWNATKNAAIVGAFVFVAGYFKNIPSQMRTSPNEANQKPAP